MPGLKQAGEISNDRLEKYLEKYGYEPMRHTSTLWKHTYRNIVFSLLVYIFGVKYSNIKDVEHLRNALKLLYLVTKIVQY